MALWWGSFDIRTFYEFYPAHEPKLFGFISLPPHAQ